MLQRVNTAKQVTFGTALAIWNIGTSTAISRKEINTISKATAYERKVYSNLGKYSLRAGRIVTGADIGLTLAQYHYTKNKTWGVEAKLYTNLTIGFMGLSKDPRVGSIAVILSVAETAGAFDPFYNEMDKLQYFSQPPAYFGGPNPR